MSPKCKDMHQIQILGIIISAMKGFGIANLNLFSDRNKVHELNDLTRDNSTLILA